MKSGIFLLFILFLTLSPVQAQEDEWDVYLANYDGQAGSVLVNMSLINSSPKSALPFVVITGVKFTNCNADGLPNDDEFKKLYASSDNALELIASQTESVMTGTFTHQCERLDYIYVKDTAGLKVRLQQMYQNKYPAYTPYINMRYDAEWSGYREFLYPNEETREYMANQSVFRQLLAAGDDLTKPRQVDHWLYFGKESDRKNFIAFAKGLNFKIENTGKVDGELPFQLMISRTDSISHSILDSVTLTLRKKAQTFNGDYDGWETIVIRK